MKDTFCVVGIGELLWDLLPEGPKLGGAVTNFACHAALLGCDAYVVSRVGTDEQGDRAISALEECGVRTTAIDRTFSRPTGTVEVALDASGQPRFDITPGSAWDTIEWSGKLAELAERADAVCFGTLAQRSEPARTTIRRFLAATRPDCLRILDVNLRSPFYDGATIIDLMTSANVLKLSDDELPVVASHCGVSGSDVDVIRALIDRDALQVVALTRGEQGALLVDKTQVCQSNPIHVEVVDSVGAGDAFAAALTIGLLRGENLAKIVDVACRVAARTCSHAGAVPESGKQDNSGIWEAS